MPFTLAHAAAAPALVRLSRGRFAVSAVVVGTLAPDLQSIVTLNSERGLGHTVPGLFLVCLPAALVMLAVWHHVIKRPLASLFPAGLGPVAAVMARPFRFGPPPQFLVVCLSALAGSATHLVWDAFTHEGAFFVRHISLLEHPVPGQAMQLYDALQYGTGLVGLVILGVWAQGWFEARRAAPPVPAPIGVAPVRLRFAALSAIALVSLTAGAANALRAAEHGPRIVVGHALLGAMAGAAMAMLTVGALLSRHLADRRLDG